MSYQETLDWLFNQLPMYQKEGVKAYKKDLSNTILLMDYLGNPENKIKAIHVAGTNGKGSTCHMLASVLQEEGYNVGLYTSPHLIDFKERIKINGAKIPERYIVDFVKKHKFFFEQNSLSFFEMTVGLSFEYFKDSNVDYVVLETGLGGRLDSTNVVNPLVSVITNIGLDHIQFLGNTLPMIASEKAGIIKFKIPVVIGEYQKETYSVFQKTADDKEAILHEAFNHGNLSYDCDLKGTYQTKNIQTAVKTIEVLNSLRIEISEQSIIKGLSNVVKNTGLLGRYQTIQLLPKIICDTAHNKEGLSLVMSQLLEESYKKLHIVFGVVDDKDLDQILSLLPSSAEYYFTKPSIKRGVSEKELKKTARQYNLKGEAYDTVQNAVNEVLLKTSEQDLIFVGGSTFVVADYLRIFKE